MTRAGGMAVIVGVVSGMDITVPGSLLQGDRTGAAASLQAAVANCPKSFIEYKGAQAELRRLS